MASKRNEIVEEQRRARQEFLKLKQMQNGELQPEAKPSEIAVLPTTPVEKFKNFWYHYKVHTILIGFVTILIAMMTVQCATREKYDMSVMYFAFEATAPAQITRAEEYFEKYAEDLNGDGEVNVKVIDCSFNSELRDMQYKHASLSKVQSIIMAEESTVVFMIDDKAKEYFDNALDYSLFESELIKMNKDFYKQTSITMETEGKMQEVTFPKDLMLGLRIIDGTAFEGKEDAMTAFDAGKKLYDKIKKQSS